MSQKHSSDTEKSVIIFSDQPVRRVWSEEKQQWFFAIVDVVRVLTDSVNPTDYINKMRLRDAELNKGWGQFVHTLWMETKGGRQQINSANVEGILRFIQSIPSQKAEPFKLWLAKVGYERLQETVDPERAVKRARENWKRLGRPESWIERRMQGQEIRNKLSDYWDGHGVATPSDYAKLTNVIHHEWTDMTVGEHKDLKNLPKQTNLRDHMCEAELLFTALAEFSTKEIANVEQADGYDENADAGKKGGGIARTARTALEEKTKKSVITGENFLDAPEQKKLDETND